MKGSFEKKIKLYSLPSSSSFLPPLGSDNPSFPTPPPGFASRHVEHWFHIMEGYPFSPGHYVTSITYREGLMALPGQRQLIDLR